MVDGGYMQSLIGCFRFSLIGLAVMLVAVFVGVIAVSGPVALAVLAGVGFGLSGAAGMLVACAAFCAIEHLLGVTAG